MALRNYLYAKHQNDSEITTRINKAEDSVSTNGSINMTNAMNGMNRDSLARQIPRYINRANRLKVHRPTNVVDTLTKNVGDIDLHPNESSIADHHGNKEEEEHCKKECENCQCKNETNADVTAPEVSTNDAPLIEVEIGGDNEIDFTNKV